MAFSQQLTLDVRTTGADTNGGGFDPALISIAFATDLSATGATGTAPVVTSAGYTFTSLQAGQYLYMPGNGVWYGGWFPITLVSGGNLTINATAGQWVTTAGLPSTVNGCASSGSPSSGHWTIDYSQAGTSALAQTTDGVIGATTTQMTSASSRPFDQSMVGNIWNWTGQSTGTCTVQRAGMISFNSTGAVATFDRALGTAASTGCTGQGGGALGSPGLAGSLINTTYQNIFVQNGVYTVTSTSSNVSAGVLSTSQGQTRVTGWSTNRNHINLDASQPFMKAGGSLGSCTLVTMTTKTRLWNFGTDSNSRSGVRGITLTRAIAFLCTTQNVSTTATGYLSSGGATFVGCTNLTSATGSNASYGAFYIPGAICYYCSVIGNAGYGFIGANGAMSSWCFNCLASGLTTSSGTGFYEVDFLANCVAYSCAGGGMQSDQAYGMVVNSGVEGNTAVGIIGSLSNGLSGGPTVVNSWGYNNTANFSDTFGTLACQSLGATAFSAAGSNNFALGAGGVTLKAAGWPTSVPGASSTATYPDIGVAQSPDTASSTTSPLISRIIQGVAR